jgi:hypothetical protein
MAQDNLPRGDLGWPKKNWYQNVEAFTGFKAYKKTKDSKKH